MARYGVIVASAVVCACGTATTTAPEELEEPGPRDASFDQALSFDGIDDYLSIGTARAPQIMREQSISLWFKSDIADEATPDALQVLFTLRRSGWSGIAIALERGVPLAYNVFGPRDLARANMAATPAVWHHLAFVIDSAASHLYLDGAELVLDKPGVIPATNRTPTQGFIGSLDGYSNLFRGQLDALRVYPRALSAPEVAGIAAGQALADAEPLVLDLPFDEISGARAYDRSGLGNHAELGDGIAQLMPERVPSGVP